MKAFPFAAQDHGIHHPYVQEDASRQGAHPMGHPAHLEPLQDDEDDDEDDEDTWDDEDVDEDEDETESDAEETENRDTAVANAEELDVTQLNGLIETLCASGNPIRNMLADPAGFSASFMLNSIGDEADVQRILDMYPDAYQKEYYLCMTEADVQDYLKNSVGLEEMSTLLEISGYENGYSSYEDGVFAMVRPDTGDFWIDEPVITEVKTVSDTEIVVSGEIRNGVALDSATSFFEIVMTVNPDSIWGGYTLSAITRWDTYILPYVDSQYLTEEDIMNWDADYLRLARNEIYARHGRQFDDEGLQNYFETCNWYVGTTSASDFDEAVGLECFDELADLLDDLDYLFCLNNNKSDIALCYKMLDNLIKRITSYKIKK